MLLQTSKLLTRILLLTFLFHASNGYTYKWLPNGVDFCGGGNWHSNKNMDVGAAQAHANIALISGPYWVGASQSYCKNKCSSLSVSGSTLLAATYEETTYNCWCYFYQTNDGVDFTPDGNIPLVSDNDWMTYFYCHDNSVLVAQNRICSQLDTVWDLTYNWECREACLEHEQCRAYSFESEGDHECRLCNSLANSLEYSGSTGHNLYKLSSAPTCGDYPGNDAASTWKAYTSNWPYTSDSDALYQDQIRHFCSSGFHTASGVNDMFQCNEFGQWDLVSGSENPTCEMNDCTVPANQYYGIEGSCIGGTMSVGEVCEVTCGDGFSSQSGTLTCTHTGHSAVIESTLDQCVPVCEIEYLPPGIVPTEDGCDVGGVQASCNVQCAEGYVPSTGTAVCTNVDGFSGLEWDIECYAIQPVAYPEEVEIYAFQFSYFCAQLLELTSAEAALSEYKANFPPNANCPTGDSSTCPDNFWFEGIYCGDSLNYEEATHLSDFTASDVAEKEYSVVGFGFCESYCDGGDDKCNVNGYVADDSSDELCKAQCEADTSCIGYAYAQETYEDAPNRCYVYSNYHDVVVPDGWSSFNKDANYIIQTTSDESHQQDVVTCYEVVPAQQAILVFAGEDSYSQALYNAMTCDGGNYFDLTFDGPCDASQYLLLDSTQEEQNWSENFMPAFGESCLTPTHDLATADHISNVGSHVTEEAYLNLHVSFPHYLEDVVLRWDSADGTVTHQPGETSDWELDNTQCSFQLQTSISYTDLNNVAVVSVNDAELSFSMHVKGTETYTEQAGYTATREVTKTLIFTLSLATSVELELDLSILSHYEAIFALDTTQLFSELGLTTEEAVAQAAALLEGYNVAVLDVQANSDLGTFRRLLADEATTTIVIAGDQEDVDAAMQALLNGDVVLDFLEGAEFTGEYTDYTQLVSVITGYAGVTNEDGTSTGTIHFQTTINEPWELSGEYTLVDFEGGVHSLVEVPEGNSCHNYQGEETICEQEWILTVAILAENVCATDLQEFTIVMESAHEDEVMEEAPISITFHVAPNSDQCQESVDLGDTSALIQGEIQVLNPNSGVYEDVPSWDIWLDDTITVEATFSTEIGVLTTASLTNMQATQEEEVCSDCLTQFEDDLNFFCESCPEDVAYTHFNDGNSITFSFTLSSNVFTGAGDGEPVSFVFSFEMSYEEGEQRRRLLKLTAPRRQLEQTQADGSGSLNLNLFGNDDEIAIISTQTDDSVSESEEKTDAVTDSYILAMVCLLAVCVVLLLVLITVVVVYTCKPVSTKSAEKSKAWE